jgi:mono/diheme cytochrome c family protein
LNTAKAARRALLAGAVLALPGCTDWAGHDLDMAAGEVGALSTMREDVIPDRYSMMRLPAEGTVPVVHPMGDVPAPYTQSQIDSIAPLLSNPLPASPVVLERGKLQYERNCAVCHGVQGDGQGSVIDPARKFPFASPLGAGSPATARSDGYLYAVIDVGRGLMPPYGHRMTHADRWAVVSYLRQLQGTSGPPPVAPQATPAAGGADTVAAGESPAPQPAVVDTAPATTQN